MNVEQQQKQHQQNNILKNTDAEQVSLTKSLGAENNKALVEYEPKDDKDCDTEAITKEEEWITKRKTELTTTRQIETRVKRQVVLEDGKVVEDSGPIVSTNTTEDTDKQETETTEKRDLGIPDDGIINVKSPALENSTEGQIAELGDGGKLIKKLVPRPSDGLVRQSNEKRVLTHEETKDYLETEDVRHHGDFSDEISPSCWKETYVKAVNSGVENLQEVLLAPENKQQLVPLGPKVVANTNKSFKTIDSEDTQKRCLAQLDGTIVTENKTVTEHEIIVDKELPDKDDKSTGSREKVTTVEATQRYYKQRDEQNVDLIADGKVVGTEMRYAAETMQMEKDGSLERPGDWDSLSDRMRKLRRPHQKTLLQQHKEAALLADRKDALTKRPLDFDREEETRKGETMKWLESHFGSESTASNESRDDDAEVEPTKKTFFNVTIKSNQAQTATATNGHKPTNTYEKKHLKEHEPHPGTGRSKYYQGISNWADRTETSAFRADLQETVEQRKRKGGGVVVSSRDKSEEGHYLVEPTKTYVSREDIIQQKRQSLSSQFLAKSRRDSLENALDSLDATATQIENTRNITGSRTDLRYGMNVQDEGKVRRGYFKGIDDRRRSPVPFNGITNRKNDYIEVRAKSYDRELNGFNDDSLGYNVKTSTLKSSRRSPSPETIHRQTNTLGRPIVPQRRRAIEKKLRQQNIVALPTKVPLDHHRTEPPPDYSPPPRSRSSSPQIDYIARSRNKDSSINMNDSTTYKTHAASTSTLMRKPNQRTRFAPTMATPTYQHSQHLRPSTATQTTQTTHSTISTSTAASASQKSSKVGQVIGNSIRKLVSMIRSASAERKLRMKSKSKSREQTPSPNLVDKQVNNSNSTTYQQYNVIDSHIGSQPINNESEHESLQQGLPISHKIETNLYSNSSILERGNQQVFKRADSADPYVKDKDSEEVNSPRQRYYLGEDPYSSTLYGKENIYDRDPIVNKHRTSKESAPSISYIQRNNREPNPPQDGHAVQQNQITLTSQTLGRHPKSSNRYAGSTPNLNQDLRTAQTLPRKLHHQHSQQQYQKSNLHFTTGHNTLSHPEKRSQYQQQHASQNLGPVKPARTYAKVLNRSKSFNVHGMNGSNNPSPIYIEKMTKNNYSHNLHSSQTYKSNPHLSSGSKESSLLQSGLKSPSIVNLISRSQRDLSKIDINEDERDFYNDQPNYTNIGQERGKHLQKEEKKQIFLKGLNQQAPDLYKALHCDEDYSVKSPSKYQLEPKHSLDSRSPIEINKDTASIIRRGSCSNDDYRASYGYAQPTEMPQNKRILMYRDEQKKRGSGSTIIEVRNIDNRK